MTIFFFIQCIIKQLLDSVFVISRIIKVSVIVIRRSLRLRVITPTSTPFILDITKSSSNNCLLSFVVNFSSFSLAENPPSDLQTTAYKQWSAHAHDPEKPHRDTLINLVSSRICLPVSSLSFSVFDFSSLSLFCPRLINLS